MATLFDQLVTELADRLTGSDTTAFQAYVNDPVGFAKDVLRINLWKKQEEILLSVRDNKNTAVSAAIATGKSYSAAAIALWYLNVFPQSKVLCTAAPPKRQIQDITFAAIRTLHKQAIERGAPLLGGNPLTLGIIASDEHWIKGITIPQSGSREERTARWHGHHAAGGVLVIADEASGVPAYLFSAFDNVTSAANCRTLLLSNPFVPSGPFWNATRDPDWNTITISAFEHPNVETGETVIAGAIDRETTELRIRRFTRPVETQDYDGNDYIFTVPWTGEKRVVTNPLFFYKVLGIFPTEAEGQLISMAHFYRARQNWDTLMDEAIRGGLSLPLDLPAPVCGLDVAELGVDDNAFVARYDHFLSQFVRWNGVEPNITAERAGRLARGCKAVRTNVDAIGPGADVAPLMRLDDLTAYGVKVSWSASKETEDYKYYRLRDQLGWEAREWFARDDVAVPPDEEFEADCFAFMYEVTRSGIRITSKTKVRERLQRSPDAWDAFTLTFYGGREKNRPDVGVESMVIGRGGGRTPIGVSRRRGAF